jgi:nucleoside-diphosphate-sugar epimerase
MARDVVERGIEGVTMSATCTPITRPPLAAPPRVGTVVVTDGSGFVGRRLLERLPPADAFTVALTRRQSELPARLVMSGALTGAALAEALEDADQIVHLAGTTHAEGESYWTENVVAAEAVARAVRHGGARRIIFLSSTGAPAPAGNEYLRAKAEAEHVLATAGCELVVLRTTHIVGPPRYPGPFVESLLPARDGVVQVPGDGLQRVAPVLVDDVVAAVTAALRGGPAGTYELAGPDEMTLDDLVTLVNRVGVVVRHVAPPLARLASWFDPSSSASAVDLVLRPSLGDPSAAVRAFGLTLHSVREAWAD